MSVFFNKIEICNVRLYFNSIYAFKWYDSMHNSFFFSLYIFKNVFLKFMLLVYCVVVGGWLTYLYTPLPYYRDNKMENGTNFSNFQMGTE